MNFTEAIRSGFANYVNFSGRATRSEFWLWALFTFIGSVAAGILDVAIFSDNAGVSPLSGVFSLITFLPSLALWVRRLHDINRTGWWVLIAVTLIGIIVLIYWACQRGTPGTNRFGPDQRFSGAMMTRQ